MKTRSTIYMTVALLSTLLFAACNNTSTKADELKNSSQTAANSAKTPVDNTVQAQQTGAANDWNNFKAEMNAQIQQNEARIQELRKKVANIRTNDRAKVDRDLNNLEKENNESRDKLEAADQTLIEKLTKQDKEAQEKSAAFQKELRHDMDTLKQSLNDFSKDKVK